MEIGSNGQSWLIRVENPDELELAENALQIGTMRARDLDYKDIRRSGISGSVIRVSVGDLLKKSTVVDEIEKYPFEYGPLDSSRIVHGLWSMAARRAELRGGDN